MIENRDYELIPNSVDENEFWGVRILSGDFVETVIQYGTLRVENDHLKFNFNIVNSPDQDLTTENRDLQSVAKEILFSILEEAAEKK